MAKLRLFKERVTQTSGETHAQDVRGMEDPALFKKSGFSAHLVVSHKPGEEILHSICDSYQLGYHEHESGGIHLQTTWQVPGEHKKQSLTLLFAALELHHHLPHAKILLHHRSGLAELLHERVVEHSYHPGEEELRHHWSNSHAPLCLDTSITEFLNHAGLHLTAGEHLTELHAEHLTRLEAEIRGETTAEQITRKAA